ncbi:gliding motility lipoprotein GldB [Croceitalea sp. MTPC9]|uniref:gliding motility lipoprotein GldB n=1 Tax=unclassified Croceitalea TaxID=2632280 RepID=UPI002B37A71D|nr:gliding motility lipoprotein GldB [Croceitalea sp. MTPC6]GMN17535.1 gliding motility lipoprotein GldB [Croceitalea sp. MTPC9]
MQKYFSILMCICLFLSCKEEDKTAEAIDKIQVDLDIIRFDRLFAEASANDIPELKADYPYLFPEQYADSIWIAKLTDTLQVELEDEVDKVFKDFDNESEQIESLFKHIKYYFPVFKEPKVITVISEVNYNDRTILADSLLFLGLDNYLGREHHFYAGLPNYVAKGLDKAYLGSNIASTFAKKVNRYPRNRSFLSRMVYYGKELYLIDKLLPSNEDYQIIGYTQEEMDWANANEEQIWRYFIEQELLYSTDVKLDQRFLDPAPFSKFGLELDSESPGRLGRYVGWQIVQAFAEKNPKITLQQILDLPADEIFKKSNYKPKR